MHLAVEVSVVDCAITNVITADRNINDKIVRALKNKVHKLDIALLVACGRRRRHLEVDAHRVACVACKRVGYVRSCICLQGAWARRHLTQSPGPHSCAGMPVVPSASVHIKWQTNLSRASYNLPSTHASALSGSPLGPVRLWR